jgi:class 3 adenylate cyclase
MRTTPRGSPRRARGHRRGRPARHAQAAERADCWQHFPSVARARAHARGHSSASARVERISGGFVAKYMGDGVLIYFGYPQAHEDDAERAVRAALAVIEAVGRLPTGEDLRVRLSIATAF